jgi:hypothetical protein
MLPAAGFAALLPLLVQPAISQNGVVNRASQIPPSLPSGSLARGAAFTIRGVHLTPAPSITLRKGGISIPVRIASASLDKIDAVLPETAPLGPATFVVSAGGAASNPFPVQIVASNPGIFSLSQRGWGPARLDNLAPQGKRTQNTGSNPAHPGQRVTLRVTGLGKGVATPLIIGNRTVSSGLPRLLAEPGEQEVSFTIPQGVPTGCYVPVYFVSSPNITSNVVTMAIHSGPGHCDSGAIPLLDQQRFGLAVFTSTNMLNGRSAGDDDEVIALFAARGLGTALSPLLLLPPPGTCTAYMSSFQADSIMPDSVASALIAQLGGDGLAAGPQLSAARGKLRRAIPGEKGAPGYYRANLGSAGNNRPRARLLQPGKFVFSGRGGVDVGPFSVTVDGPARFEWTNRATVQTVERGRPLSLAWRGQATGQMTIILATNVDQITTAVGACLCSAPLNATHFEIPAALLANIPASAVSMGIPYDQLFVASLPAKSANPFRAQGLDTGAVLTIFANGRFVKYH